MNICELLRIRDEREKEPFIEIFKLIKSTQSSQDPETTQELALLKSQNQELYKQIAANSSSLFEFLQLKSDLENKVSTYSTQISKRDELIATLNKKIIESQEILILKNTDIQNLNDELNVYRLELTVKERQLLESVQKITALEQENTRLIDIVIKTKEQQVDKLNEMNETVKKIPSKQTSSISFKDPRIQCHLPTSLIKKFVCLNLTQDCS